MEKYFILYNPLAGEQEGELIAQSIDVIMEHVIGMADITRITNYSAFLSDKQDCNIVLVGGDGTLHHFVNDTRDMLLANRIFLYPAGKENRFLKSRGCYRTDKPSEITDYLKENPDCVVKCQKLRYIDTVVMGTVNWRELIFQYQPVDVQININSELKTYKKVWTILATRWPKPGIFIIQGKRWSAVKTLRRFEKEMALKQTKEILFLPADKNFRVEMQEEKMCQVDGEMIGSTECINICMKGACR